MVGALERSYSDTDFTSLDVKNADEWVGADTRGLVSGLDSSRYFERESERKYRGPGFEVYVVSEEESPTEDPGVAYSFDPEAENFKPAATELAAGVLRDSRDVSGSFANEVEEELWSAAEEDFALEYDPKKVRHDGPVPSGRREREYGQEFEPDGEDAVGHFFGSEGELVPDGGSTMEEVDHEGGVQEVYRRGR